MFNDIRYALRVLAKHRGFTFVVIMTLAIGIGANTAIFSMADAIVFHPYSFPELDRIVTLWETIPSVSADRYGVSPANYLDWKERSHVFNQAAAYKSWNATLTSTDGSHRVRANLVSPEFFPLLGIKPAEGRSTSSVPNEVVISYGFWQRRLGREPHPVGRSLELNGLRYTIVGVMGQEFDFPMYAELWAPWVVTPEIRVDRFSNDLQVIGRIKNGISLPQAQAEMRAIGTQLSREYPRSNSGRGIGVMLLRDTVDEYAGRFMTIVTGAVLFLLVLACANVANLQLARGASRQNEIALRMALGASRSRIVAQLFTEGLVLSLAGAILGLPLALWGLGLIKSSLPELISRHVPGLAHAQLDARMLTFTLLAAGLTGIAFSIPAAAQACSEHLQETLRSGGRGLVSPGRRGMRSALVVSELVLAAALLIGAGLMLKGFRNLAGTSKGFDPNPVLTFEISLPESRYRQNYEVANLYSELLRRLEAIPGMRSADLVNVMPALDNTSSSPVVIDGQARASVDRPILAEIRVVSGKYFQTFSIPIQQGRSFSTQDTADHAPVAVISQAAARRFWPGQDILGRRVRLASPGSNSPWLVVVGVAGDVKHFILSDEVRPTIYLPYLQQPARSFSIVMQTSAPLERTSADVRAAVRAVDATLSVPDIEKLSTIFADLAAAVGVVATLMGVFASMALILAAAGIYAVISYSVAQRTREIGIRMALGARPEDVLKLIIGNAIRLVSVGLAIGCLAAFALSKGMSSTLPGVVALDAFTFAGFAALLTMIALAASLIPSRRATKVDPLIALRTE